MPSLPTWLWRPKTQVFPLPVVPKNYSLCFGKITSKIVFTIILTIWLIGSLSYFVWIVYDLFSQNKWSAFRFSDYPNIATQIWQVPLGFLGIRVIQTQKPSYMQLFLIVMLTAQIFSFIYTTLNYAKQIREINERAEIKHHFYGEPLKKFPKKGLYTLAAIQIFIYSCIFTVVASYYRYIRDRQLAKESFDAPVVLTAPLEEQNLPLNK
ncbi:unnamed protein product, partial [Mesorhabditis spiculigera]